MAIYGYIRVSTDGQDTENQKFEITKFGYNNGFLIDKWVDETVSGTKQPDKRLLGELLQKMKAGDRIVCSELSRLGRSLFMIMDILNICMKRDVQVWTIKDNYRLGDDISSKVLAFAFGLSAEIERNLISQRTKEALNRKRAEGVILGRPSGSRSKRVKLTGKEAEIINLLEKRVSVSAIARVTGVHRLTLSAFIKDGRLYEPPQENVVKVKKNKKNRKTI